MCGAPNLKLSGAKLELNKSSTKVILSTLKTPHGKKDHGNSWPYVQCNLTCPFLFVILEEESSTALDRGSSRGQLVLDLIWASLQLLFISTLCQNAHFTAKRLSQTSCPSLAQSPRAPRWHLLAMGWMHFSRKCHRAKRDLETEGKPEESKASYAWNKGVGLFHKMGYYILSANCAPILNFKSLLNKMKCHLI